MIRPMWAPTAGKIDSFIGRKELGIYRQTAVGENFQEMGTCWGVGAHPRIKKPGDHKGKGNGRFNGSGGEKKKKY